MELADGLNIEAYSIMNSQNVTMQSVGVALLSNALEQQEVMGDEIAKMMEQSVNPFVGQTFDTRV